MKIRNVKLSAKLKSCPLDIAINKLKTKKINFREFGNFISFTYVYSFVVFKPSKNGETHANITKVPRLKGHVKKCLSVLKKLLRTDIISFTVDNIIATTDLEKKVCLEKISRERKNVVYNNERFPGLFIKFRYGTSIVYHSGKIVIVGCKTVRRLIKIKKWLHAHI
jgi:hypothetical protein